MIEFRTLPDDHPDLAHSPLLRAALLTLQYTHEHGAIGLTKTKAFKRVFVHWAVAHFDWPDSSAEEMSGTTRSSTNASSHRLRVCAAYAPLIFGLCSAVLLLERRFMSSPGSPGRGHCEAIAGWA